MQTNNQVNIFLKISIFFILLLGFYNALILGASWDEPFHHILGIERLAYLLSFGNLKNYSFGVSQYYPGFYDTFAASIYFFIEKINFNFAVNYLVQIKHITNFLFSTISVFGLYKVLKLFSKNKNFSLLVCFITLLNPFFFGHLSINPKDIIIFFSLIWFIYFFSIYILYKKNLKFLILFSIFLGFGCGTRLSFIVLPLPIILFGIVYNFKKFDLTFINFIKKNFSHFAISLTIVCFFSFITWPHLHSLDFDIIRATVLKSIKWTAGPKLGLINGFFYETFATPKTYFLSFLLYKMPIYQSVLFFCSIFIIFFKKNFFCKKINNFLVIRNFCLLFLSYIVLLVLCLNVKIYDGIRLFLFLIPFFCTICGFFIFYFFDNFKNNFNKLTIVIIVVFFLLSLLRFISLNPYQYVYLNYNPNINNSGFEHDYWNVSFKELIKKIPDEIDGKNVSDYNFFICGGDYQVAHYYLVNKFKTKINITNFQKADLSIMTNRASFNVKDKRTCFQKYLGDELLSINRGNIKLSKLIKISK